MVFRIRFIYKFTADAAIRFSSAVYSLMDVDQIDGRSFPLRSLRQRDYFTRRDSLRSFPCIVNEKTRH